MPHYNIWIREQDDSKWKAIENRSEWLHQKLGGGQTPIRHTTETKAFVPRPPDPETGYSCCQKNTPCKHWSFDGGRGLWVNELTGHTKATE